MITIKDFMKDSVVQGTYEEHVAEYEDLDISVTCWKDNKFVILVLTYIGSEPAKTVNIYDKKQKKQITIACLKLVKD